MYLKNQDMINFVIEQFKRFNANPIPDVEIISKVANGVMDYIADTDYFPETQQEKVDRWNSPGCNAQEKTQLVSVLDLELRAKQGLRFNYPQLHLMVWASIMYCWTEQGEYDVEDYKEAKEFCATL